MSRRIEAYDQETGDVFVFLTNNVELGATTIVAIYKDRWQIEIFFKALKQYLKIKTFIGTSGNLEALISILPPFHPGALTLFSVPPVTYFSG
jgi:IS4 transposase